MDKLRLPEIYTNKLVESIKALLRENVDIFTGKGWRFEGEVNFRKIKFVNEKKGYEAYIDPIGGSNIFFLKEDNRKKYAVRKEIEATDTMFEADPKKDAQKLFKFFVFDIGDEGIIRKLEVFRLALRKEKAAYIDPHKRADMIKMLDLIREKKCCAYSQQNGKICDCKFGVSEESLERGAFSEQGNGCPELYVLINKLKNMSDSDYEKLSERKPNDFLENLIHEDLQTGEDG